MAPSSPIARLTDIIEAIGLVQAELVGTTLVAFELERGVEIISEASRRLSSEMKARHPAIPWRKVAGIGNILRHEYQDVAHDVLWHMVHNNLPPLEKICREELAAEIARDAP